MDKYHLFLIERLRDLVADHPDIYEEYTRLINRFNSIPPRIQNIGLREIYISLREMDPKNKESILEAFEKEFGQSVYQLTNFTD